MLYTLVRPVARYVLSWYYRRIEVDGLEHIPREGPVILAANHPTAFIEPCILACYQPRRLWFLARGDLFKNGLATWALNRLHILPVYRIEDGGYSKLKHNFTTFSACTSALSKGRGLMILAEGRCIHEKRLRPLRKGTGRVALSTLVAHPELRDIPIVPIGVNFTEAEKMRSEVYLRCGPPLSTAAFLETYRENENRGVLELTRALAKALDPLVLQIPDISLDGVGETLLEIGRNERQSSLGYGLVSSGELLDQQLRIARSLSEADASALQRYSNRLQRHGLKDAAVRGDWQQYLRLGPLGWLRCFVAVILLLWQLPLLLVAEYIGGVSTRAIEFYSPVRFAAIAIGLVAYYPLWFIGLNPWLIAYATVSLLGSRWAWRNFEAAQRWFHARMVWRQIPAERQLLHQLRRLAVQQLPE